MVYQKGASVRKAVYVWGETLAEILADASERLDLPRPAKLLYDEDGSKVSDFEQMERDSLLCVTSGDTIRGRRELLLLVMSWLAKIYFSRI